MKKNFLSIICFFLFFQTFSQVYTNKEVGNIVLDFNKF
jgi:hypothetical protein